MNNPAKIAARLALHGKRPTVGQLAKVWLPGETPWAECMAVLADGKWVGRIDNKLIGESAEAREREGKLWGPNAGPLPKLHDFRQNQLVIFEEVSTQETFTWQPYKQDREP